jgi:ABC-2 type transport system ATP-binding protein
MSAAAAAIETRGLTKYYGAVVGLENLSLEVAQGEVFGFLGANGAGKTTTIRMLLDLVRPTRGTASILYSHGMKRKLGLIQALMTEAPVLVLDEPTSGLDPLMIEAFSQTVDELARGGRTTVFLSSHILSEVDRICQRIGLVRGGQLVAVRTLKELRAAAPRRMTVSFSAPVSDDMPSLAGATLVGREPARWVLDVEGPLGDIIPRLGNLPVADVQLAAFTLDEAILRLMGSRPSRAESRDGEAGPK